MRVTDQLGLVCALLAASSEANPLTQRQNPDTFSVTQVGRPVPPREYRGRHAINRVLRKFGNGNAPSIPPPKQAQTPMKKSKTGKSKSKAPPGASKTTADSADNDQEYVCEVEIGGQKTKLNFDTGSSDMWVYSTLQPSDQTKSRDGVYDPKKSTTSKEWQGGTWKISYGDGSSASGVVHTDNVKIGDVTAEGQAIELAKNVSDSFKSDHSNNGLLGLGFPKGSSDGAGNTISVDGKPSPQNTYFANVRPKLPLPLFTADLKHQAAGSYDFGFIDKKKYTGDIKYFDADTSAAYWGVTSQRYGIAGQQPVDKEIKTIIDTGTTLLLMPQDVLDAYYKNVKSSRNDANLGGYVFPCSEKVPDFTIGFGKAPNDFTATIPAKYMNFGPAVTTDPSTCFGAMQFMSASDSLQAIYGDVFLKAVFTVFEAKTDDKARLGFAMKPEARDGATPTTTGGGSSTGSPSPTATCSTDGDKGKGVSVFTNFFNTIKGWFTGGKKGSDTCPAPNGDGGDGGDGGDEGDGGDGDDGGDGSDGADGGDGEDNTEDGGDAKGDEDAKKASKDKSKAKQKPAKKVEDGDDGEKDEKPKKEKDDEKDDKKSDEEEDKKEVGGENEDEKGEEEENEEEAAGQ